MCKILAVSLLTFSCLAPSDEQLHRSRRPFVCIVCSNLRPNNTCVENWRLCYAARHEVCFNRLVIKDGAIALAERGCTSDCSPVLASQHYRNFTWCCNYRKYCNSRNPWTHDFLLELI